MKLGNTTNVVTTTASAFVRVGLILLTIAVPASAGENAKLHGKTLGEWAAGWWQWQEANYPGFSFGEGVVDCSLGQSGPVWYLGGTGGGAVQRECDAPIKGHKHLMFPLVNAAMHNPDDWCVALFGNADCSVEQKREILDGLFSEEPAGIFNSKGCLIQAEVNGVPVVFSTSIVRTQSPPFEYSGNPDDPALPVDPEAVADGFWVALPPLPRGEHTIRFTGGVCDVDTGEAFFSVEVTYDLRIAGKGKDDDEDEDEDED